MDTGGSIRNGKGRMGNGTRTSHTIGGLMADLSRIEAWIQKEDEELQYTPDIGEEDEPPLIIIGSRAYTMCLCSECCTQLILVATREGNQWVLSLDGMRSS